MVDAVLYLECDPVTEENIAKITGLSLDVVRLCIEKLHGEYSEATRGVELTKMMGGWMLVPKQELRESLKERYGKKNEAKLSRAAMETLSIIAYSQPVTRAEVESIRGVSADNMMRLLLDKQLIKEVGKKDLPGKPSLYGTTKEFLKVFQLNSIAELPKLDDGDADRFELAR
ncbi:MAG: SMC-Scp complex subunit ScpB [Treponema sp.]|nr:MAG: SMC-Scp complex subunit ScpB [Treponema sp.]